MKAREIMTPNADYIEANETIDNVARRLATNDIGSMPICEGDHLRGMITDRDIVTKVIAKGRNPAEVRARDLETGNPVTTMARHKVRRLPVIDGHKLIGMVSQADLVKNLPPDKVTKMLQAVST